MDIESRNIFVQIIDRTLFDWLTPIQYSVGRYFFDHLFKDDALVFLAACVALQSQFNAEKIQGNHAMAILTMVMMDSIKAFT